MFLRAEFVFFNICVGHIAIAYGPLYVYYFLIKTIFLLLLLYIIHVLHNYILYFNYSAAL